MATISSSIFNLSRVQNAVFTIESERVISYFLTSFNLPGLSIGTVPLANPFKEHVEPGGTLSYEELSIECLVSENFDNWKASVDWLQTASTGFTFPATNEGKTVRRSGSIVLLTNNGNRFGDIGIINMFPTNISSIDFDMQNSEPVPLTFSMTLQFESYKVNFDTNAEI
tara:strand:- start:119 stop:625 length:507 start_codon:yes stop_codon:yes gene_type:complete